MAKTVATLIGILFILAGLIGFAIPSLMGAHLSPAHNIIHLVSGAASLYLGLKGTLSAAKMFGFIFGAAYLLLGVAGFLFQAPYTEGMHTEIVFRVIPGILELGRMDHIIHVVIGLAYLAGAFLTSTAAQPPVSAD